MTQQGLPTKRERLKAMMRLKSQRRMMAGALAILVPLTGALAAVSMTGEAEAEVALGTGVAGIDDDALVAEAEIDLPEPQAEEPVIEMIDEAGEEIEDVVEDVAESLGIGEASYYGNELAGNRTASGEVFDPAKMTAAHRTLPLGSRVRVTHQRNGRSVVVRINDRGPFHGNRVIDLSEGAARRIGMVGAGRAQVGLELLAD